MRKILLSFVLCSLGFINLQAASLDGTSSVKYKDKNYVFRKHDFAKGFVYLNDGFTIMPDRDAEVSFDVPFPIKNGMDLRDTATLRLDGDLYLDSNFTISSGGNINGLGKAIFLGGDLTISDTTYVRVIHIKSDTILDGKGHNLILGNRCKLFVDDNVTLTLRNLVIKPTYNPGADPCIRLASHRSKLALDNVNFNMQNDFDFREGQIFIYNDVVFSGTNAFLYHSTQPSFITKNAVLYFDQDTTLLINPATFTDCNFQVKNTYTSNGFIRMEDETSQIYFNNCSLNTTLTGCKFTKGTINFDNKVTVTSQVGGTIGSVGKVGSDVPTGTHPWDCTWSHDSRYIAVVNYDASTLQVFRIDGSSTPTQVGSDVSTADGAQSVAWSPDGRFIAVTSIHVGILQIFKFDGSSTPTQVGSNVDAGNWAQYVAWSPDGRFVAVTTAFSSYLQIYKFDGVSTPTQIGSNTSVGPLPFQVTWSPDGKFIAVVDSDSDTIRIFRFDGMSTPIQVGSDVSTGDSPNSIAWSPDSRFIACTNSNLASFQIFRFDGSSATLVGSAYTGNAPIKVTWDPSGRFIAVLSYGSDVIKVFKFEGSSNPTQFISDISTGPFPMSLEWSHDGNFIAVINYGSNSLGVFKINLSYDSTPQALSNSVVFKDLSGIEPETNVNVLAGAQVKLDGLMCV